MGKMIMNGIPYGGGEVEANPTGTPTDTLNTIGINNTIYDIAGGDSNVFGAFIDTNRVIQPFILVQDTQEHSYTATEDCIVIYNIANAANTDTYIKVDNILMGGQYTQNINSAYGYVYLKTGQTFTYQQTYTGSTTTGYMVYGLTFGTNNIFTPQIYSLEEREVGVWIDGKPLYQKSLTGTLTSTATLFNITDLNIDELIKWEVMVNSIYDNKPFKVYLSTNADADKVNTSFYNGDMRIHTSSFWVGSSYFATIFYTKTTDTPGSGEWTPSGVPAHHYSTDEQVVGTWIDGSTVYEKTVAVNFTVRTSAQDITSIMDFTGIKQFISFIGFYTGSGEEGIFPISAYRYNNKVMARSIEDAVIDHVTIQYTKTT